MPASQTSPALTTTPMVRNSCITGYFRMPGSLAGSRTDPLRRRRASTEVRSTLQNNKNLKNPKDEAIATSTTTARSAVPRRRRVYCWRCHVTEFSRCLTLYVFCDDLQTSADVHRMEGGGTRTSRASLASIPTTHSLASLAEGSRMRAVSHKHALSNWLRYRFGN
jgi:hypothetical protein